MDHDVATTVVPPWVAMASSTALAMDTTTAFAMGTTVALAVAAPWTMETLWTLPWKPAACHGSP